jgi:hypothetical protein
MGSSEGQLSAEVAKVAHAVRKRLRHSGRERARMRRMGDVANADMSSLE